MTTTEDQRAFVAELIGYIDDETKDQLERQDFWSQASCDEAYSRQKERIKELKDRAEELFPKEV